MQGDGGRAGTHHDPTGTDAPSWTWQGCRPARSSRRDRGLGGGAARPGDGGAAEPARDVGGRSAGQGVSMVAGPDPHERAAAVALNLELSHGRHGASARIEIHEKASGRVALLALFGWLDGTAVSQLGRSLDATLGDGGHAAAVLAARPDVRLLGCDRDPDGLVHAARRLQEFGPRVTLAQASFRELPGAVARAGGEPLAGALLDLGMSSRQLDDPARGMSFQAQGPLDLRMDRTRGLPASERLRGLAAEELAQLLRELGDLRDAMRLARAILSAVERGRLQTTADLVRAIDGAGGARHPRRYAQVFQALRMWTNDERGELEQVLAWLPEAMRPGGVVVTLAYHSGEDRSIKRALRGARMTPPARPPPQIP